MSIKNLNLFIKILDRFWLIPALISALSLVITCIIFFLDVILIENDFFGELVFFISIDGIRSLSLTILASMISMTVLAISITMVVLSLAASQLGPRLIRNFLSDIKTQFFIGAFFSFVFSALFATLALHSSVIDEKLPIILCSGLVFFSFVFLFFLLAYVQHVAQASIADRVVESVGDALDEACGRIMAELKQGGGSRVDREAWSTPEGLPPRGLTARSDGYIQKVDYHRLAALGRKRNALLDLSVEPGDLILPRQRIVRTYGVSEYELEDFQSEALGAIAIGPERTPTQDVAHIVRQLLEIALRALSPSLNDVFTAIAVLDRLSRSLARLADFPAHQSVFADTEQTPRLHAIRSDDFAIIADALGRLAAQGASDAIYMRVYVRRLSALLETVEEPDKRKMLGRLAEQARRQLDAMTEEEEATTLGEALRKIEKQAKKKRASPASTAEQDDSGFGRSE